MEQAYQDIASLANDMYSPFDAGYPSELPQREQDLDQAKSLLKQAGYDNNLTVELVTSEGIGSGALTSAQVFSEQAKGAGVTVAVKNLDSFYNSKSYLSWPFSMDWWLTRNYLVQATQCGTPGAPYNETHWNNQEWDALVKEAFATTDDAKRAELVSQAATIDYNEGGYIIPSFSNILDAYNGDKVHGLIENDRNGQPLALYRLDTVYLT